MAINILTQQQIKSKYNTQKGNAKIRGIEWKITFEEWLAWWGNDINQRGKGVNELQMQRFHDKGAYELGNIVKGYPLQNARTRGYGLQLKRQQKLAQEHQRNLDALMWQPSAPEKEHYVGEYEAEMKSTNAKYSAFTIDKRI